MNNQDLDYLAHYGVLGMKWGVRKRKPSSGKRRKQRKQIGHEGDIVIDKGADIHRIVPKKWLDKEKTYSGHAYASYKKEDTEQYKKFARMFGDGNNYVDMQFKLKDLLVSPSKEKRIDEFIRLMDSNTDARSAMLKATRNILCFMPKSRLDKLDNPKQAQKAYEKFSYLLVSNRDLRDPYFKQLEEQGYSMILDDADIRSGIAKSPIIVFDRKKSLKLESNKTIGR